MKPLIKESLREYIYYYSLLYLALSLPFQFLWFPPTIGIISLMLAWILSFNYRNKWQYLKLNSPLITVLFLFLVSLFGMLYTTNPHEGWKDVTVKISLLFFPLAIGTVAPLSKEKLIRVLKLFAYTITVAIVILLIIASYNFLEDGNIRHFLYTDFASLDRVPIHYFALYVNLAFFILLSQSTFSLQPKKLKKTFFNLILLIILAAALFLCSVRIQFIAFALGMITYMVYYFKNTFKPYQLGLIILGMLLFLFSLAWVFPESRRRIKETVDEISAYQGKEELKQMNHRVYLWKYGIKVIKENFWLGTGTGAANDALYEYLRKEKAQFWDGEGTYTLARKKYNLHNEFLQHFVSFGLLGLLVLCLTFILGFRNLSVDYPFIALTFLLLSLISFNTESMLERQAGNLFFAFFFALLIAQPKKQIT